MKGEYPGGKELMTYSTYSTPVWMGSGVTHEAGLSAKYQILSEIGSSSSTV